MWILTVVALIGFASCGGSSSEEAKELLKKILRVIGIPPTVIVNICQDNNNNDFCELTELQAKVTITKGDNMADIWEKLTETSEGRYLLETTTPCTPILLELQDSDVGYDDGEFVLKYSGVEFGQISKELSILEAMVDAGHLSSSNVQLIKNLNNVEDQNKFYATLYQDLKTNLNTLRAVDLTKTQAMIGNLKEMAEELVAFGVDKAFPDRINDCNGSIACVDGELRELSRRLIIDDNERDAIVDLQRDNNSSMRVIEMSCEESKSANFILPNGIMKDTVEEKSNGESLPDFINFSEVSVDVTDTNIRVEMTFVELPVEFEINKIRIAHLEYVWGIYFDIDDSSQIKEGFKIQEGNISFLLTYYSRLSDRESPAAILDFALPSIMFPETGEDGIVTLSSVFIEGNKIIFNVAKSLDKNLNKITSSTKVRFTAIYCNGICYEDSYPN